MTKLFSHRLCRSDRLPGHDGGRLRVGRPGRPHRPAADPPHLALHQQRLCLLLVLRPGLRLLPVLPPGLRRRVSGSRRMTHPALSHNDSRRRNVTGPRTDGETGIVCQEGVNTAAALCAERFLLSSMRAEESHSPLNVAYVELNNIHN